MKIMKFGGTSVGSPQRIKNVATLITKENGNIVVLSAMSGTTNSLLEISGAIKRGDKNTASDIISDLRKKYDKVVDELFVSAEYKQAANSKLDEIFNIINEFKDKDYSIATEKNIVAQGEILSTNLMYLYLKETGFNPALVSAFDYMRTDAHGDPDFDYIKIHSKESFARHSANNVIITQGFICRNSKGEIDNLCRGGSDYTASLIGAALKADVVEIWTDIDGMHNNDPRFVENTDPVHYLHFEEAAELAYFGAKILHPTCILPAKETNVPVRLLNTMDPEAEGTLINNRIDHSTIKAVAAKDNITAIKIKSGRMLLAYGFLKNVFEVFEKYETPIDMITTSEVGVSVTIDDEKHLDEIINDLSRLGTVSVDKDMVIICVVGDLDWRNKGFETKALMAFNDIPVRMISYGGSNYNISFLVSREDKIRALESLSRNLFK